MAKNYKNMNWVMIFSIIAGFFVICTAIAQSLREKKHDLERLADKNEIIKLQQENNDTLNKINRLQEELILSTKKLNEANERIEALNLHQTNYLTGGNSFGYIDILRILDSNQEELITFAFNKIGEYPMYNVKVSYSNVEDFKVHRPDGRATIEDIKNHAQVTIGVISNNNSYPFGPTFKIKEDGIAKINFIIGSRNGSFSELLRIYRHGKTICCAYQVNGITDGKTKSKILKEHIDKEYPRNKDGQVDWK